MSVPLSRKLAIVKRRHQVASLFLEGWTQDAIAEHLNVTQAAVSKDIKQVTVVWRESSIRDFDAARSLQLAKLDLIEKEAWAAFRKSQQPAQIATVDGQPGNQKAKRTVRHQHGDPRFLQIALDAIEARRQMLGLDAPTKIAPTTPDGQPLTNEQRIVMIEAVLTEQYGPETPGTEEPSHEQGQSPTSPEDPGESVGRRVATDQPHLLALDQSADAASSTS